MSYSDWLSSQPPIVQEAARKWPLGSPIEFVVDGESMGTYWVVGYRECPHCGIDLIGSEFNPAVDGELAYEEDSWSFFNSKAFRIQGQ